MASSSKSFIQGYLSLSKEAGLRELADNFRSFNSPVKMFDFKTPGTTTDISGPVHYGSLLSNDPSRQARTAAFNTNKDLLKNLRTSTGYRKSGLFSSDIPGSNTQTKIRSQRPKGYAVGTDAYGKKELKVDPSGLNPFKTNVGRVNLTDAANNAYQSAL